jgi:hypothetical protein
MQTRPEPLKTLPANNSILHQHSVLLVVPPFLCQHAGMGIRLQHVLLVYWCWWQRPPPQCTAAQARHKTA